MGIMVVKAFKHRYVNIAATELLRASVLYLNLFKIVWIQMT